MIQVTYSPNESTLDIVVEEFDDIDAAVERAMELYSDFGIRAIVEEID
jgi:hypothetical protein